MNERRAFAEDLQQDAVWMKKKSGRTIARITEDLGLGPSTLRWKGEHGEDALFNTAIVRGMRGIGRMIVIGALATIGLVFTFFGVVTI